VKAADRKCVRATPNADEPGLDEGDVKRLLSEYVAGRRNVDQLVIALWEAIP
jgi:hypothetical protein